MKRVFAVFTLALLPLVLASAQTESERSTETEVVAPPTVSPDDLRHATNEVKRAIEEGLEQKSAEQTNEILDQTSKAVSTSQEKVLAEMERRDASRKEESDRQQQATMRTLQIGGGVLLFSMMVIALLVIRKNRNRAAVTPISRPELVREEKAEILVNPTADEVKNYSARNNNIQQVPYVLSLSEGSYNCTALLQGTKAPAMMFEGSNEKVSWDKQKQMAQTLGRLVA